MVHMAYACSDTVCWDRISDLWACCLLQTYCAAGLMTRISSLLVFARCTLHLTTADLQDYQTIGIFYSKIVEKYVSVTTH